MSQGDQALQIEFEKNYTPTILVRLEDGTCIPLNDFKGNCEMGKDGMRREIPAAPTKPATLANNPS